LLLFEFIYEAYVLNLKFQNVRQAFLWAYADSDIASVQATESGVSYVTFRPAL